MANNYVFTFTSNVTDCIRVTKEAAEKALEICGGKAETYAKQNCPVDTGLLRNSITHAMAGTRPTAEYRSSGMNKKGKAVAVKTGSYGGALPKDEDGQVSVYIGSNVEYAPHVELGTVNQNAQPYLVPAVENHMKEYEQVITDELRKSKYSK